MKKIIALVIFLVAFSLLSEISYAQPMNPRLERCPPTYGKYSCDPKCGWYGAKRIVRTSADAREIISRFFSFDKDIRIGVIRERNSYFEAEITDETDEMIDLVIIDKRTGRIRSIY
jgi:hypothetical protein